MVSTYGVLFNFVKDAEKLELIFLKRKTAPQE
jgi:hypothetical protein